MRAACRGDRARPRVAPALAACAWLLGLALPARAQDEVPFITTPDRVTVAMLELAAVNERDHVLDLGSGDGRIVITAAKRFGASGLGVEIVPDLVRRSRDNARAAGVAARAEFREQDLFATDLSRATVVTMYLLPEVNLQLRSRLLALAAGTRIVSHDWDLGEWQPDRELTLPVPDKAIGRDKRSRVMLWVVPAQVQGAWCSAGHGTGAGSENHALQLEVTQRFQRFSATLQQVRGAGGANVANAVNPANAIHAVPVAVFDGRIEGFVLRSESAAMTAPAQLRAAPDVSTLQLELLGGPGAGYAGRAFRRAGAAGC